MVSDALGDWKNSGNDAILGDEITGTEKWNIDHIKPQSDFVFTSFEDIEVIKCWGLDNLRPLSAKQNVIDGARRIRHKKNATYIVDTDKEDINGSY